MALSGREGLMRLDVARQKLALHWNRRIVSRFTRDDARSELPVALMVPVAPKDCARAARSIPVMRERIVHPLERVAVIAPVTEETRDLCSALGVELIDEAQPLAGLLGNGAAGTSGWIKQQFLKLDCPRILGCENVVTMDSDTYPLRPVSFCRPDGRMVLYNGDPNQAPFHRFTEAALGGLPTNPSNFVAHCMLFHGPFLDALHDAIETRHRKPWTEALLDLTSQPADKVGSMSEFDLYGQYVCRTFPNRVTQRWYAGIKVTSGQFSGAAPLPGWKRRFRFVSNHQRG